MKVMYRVAILGFAVFAAPLLSAQNASVQQQAQPWNPQQVLHTETYVKPPAVVERIIMSPRTDISFTSPSPDKKWFVRTVGADRGDINDFGKAHVNLGGVQIDTKANRARTLTTSTRRGLTLIDPRTMTTRTIETPKDASISAPSWSPTGTHLAYVANFDDASYIYVADVSNGKATRITQAPLLATLFTTLDWTADGKSIVTVLVPDARGAAPVFGNKGIADGPQVKLTESRALPQVIHPALLQTPYDRAMLKYYTTGQLALIDVRSKRAQKIGAPAMIRSADASPDGKFFRVTKVTEPFSYIVPVSNFGTVEELWDANGALVTTLAKTPLREGERSGRRRYSGRWSRRRAVVAERHGQAQHSVESGGRWPRVHAVGLPGRHRAASRWSRWRGGSTASAADVGPLHELDAALWPDATRSWSTREQVA